MASQNITNNNVMICRTLFEKLHLLSVTERNVLLSTNIVIAVLNMFINAMLIALIRSTKQYTNLSLRLTMYMSASDFFVGAVSQHMMTYFIVSADSSIQCNVQVMSQYILYLFPHLTGYFVGLVALDRYLRVKYTNKYGDIMTLRRQTIGVVIVIVFAVLNCMILISGIFTDNWKVALLGYQPLDLIFVMTDIFLYWRSIVLMREHMKANSIEMKHFNKSISKLATIYLVLVIIFYPPYLLLDLIQTFVNSSDTTIVFWHIMSLIWIFLNSSINGVSFVIVNRKAQRKLREWKVKICGQSSQVKPDQMQIDSSKIVDN